MRSNTSPPCDERQDAGAGRRAAEQCADRLLTQLEGARPSGVSTAESLSTDPRFSADLLLEVTIALAHRDDVMTALDCEGRLLTPKRRNGARTALRRYFQREVERLMARGSVEGDPAFDPSTRPTRCRV